MLSLAEADTVNIILLQKHLHKVGSWGLVAEDHHLEIVVWQAHIVIGELLLAFGLFKTLLPLLTSFSSASKRASVFLVGATRRNFCDIQGRRGLFINWILGDADLRHMKHDPVDLISRDFQHLLSIKISTCFLQLERRTFKLRYQDYGYVSKWLPLGSSPHSYLYQSWWGRRPLPS